MNCLKLGDLEVGDVLFDKSQNRILKVFDTENKDLRYVTITWKHRKGVKLRQRHIDKYNIVYHEDALKKKQLKQETDNWLDERKGI